MDTSRAVPHLDPLADPSRPKRFEAEIVLTTCSDGHPSGEVRLRRRVTAATWDEARAHLAELPFEDLVHDDVEVLDIEISLVGWTDPRPD